MELKLFHFFELFSKKLLLIVPYGIETITVYTDKAVGDIF